ncbi:tyrosine-type recombinase/integrase [Jeotgalibaca porci]|uniref:tyrosine-type recombinase/integrase n=1 Tax=Jeotgalibaca porci TaxID=1868793 RepID=UPI00359FCBA3
MSTDTARMLQELEILTTTLLPEADSVKMKIRYEEIVSNYTVNRRTPLSLENDVTDKINLFISAKKLEGLSEVTLSGYRLALNRFSNFVDKPAIGINTPDIRSYLSADDTLMSSTISKNLSVIKTFFSWLVDEEILLKNPASKIKHIKQPKRLPKAVTVTELEILREACETTRERALIEVLYSTGCRLSEASGIQTGAINWSSGAINVIGKGDKERIVYLNPRAIYHLKAYLKEREENEDDCPYLFATVRRPYRQMKNKTIQDEISKISNRTNIDKNIHPHTFRHTMSTVAMENGIELGDLQQLLGHENPSTTLIYSGVSEERKQQAHKRYVP